MGDTQDTQFGKREHVPDSRVLCAGPLRLILQNGMLRYIRYGQMEIVRGIYVAVRDKNWSTIEPRYHSFHVVEEYDRFRISFVAEHQSEDVHFAWNGEVTGDCDGTIHFSMDGEAKKTFLKNRIGFCVLHPMTLAGTKLAVTTPDGTVNGEFPKTISPHQPFMNIVAMRHPVVAGIDAEIAFSGDVFEMEDQRNWTDASYKTYCTPLSIPYPVQVPQGYRVRQTVILRLTGQPASVVQLKDSGKIQMYVGAECVGKLPDIGLLVSPVRKCLAGEIRKLRDVNIGHVFAELDIGREDWTPGWKTVLDWARQLQVPLDLSLVTDGRTDPKKRFFELLSGMDHPVRRLAVFQKPSYVTSLESLGEMRRLSREFGVPLHVGGGTRANFAELNRARPPFESMDFVIYSMNPQVHAFDLQSMAETLPAQAETVKSLRTFAGGVPISVGPITLKPRFNPYATRPDDENGGNRYDPRQKSLFAAGWTVGSIASLAMERVDAISYYETVGDGGILERGGTTEYPVYYIFKNILEFSGADVLPLEISEPLIIQALALCRGGQLRILIANMSDSEQTVRVGIPDSLDLDIRSVTEMKGSSSMNGGNGLLRRQMDTRTLSDMSWTSGIRLSPFAVITMDCELEHPR